MLDIVRFGLAQIMKQRTTPDELEAMLTGLAASEPDDEKRMTRGTQLMENLYAFFQRQRAG